VIIRLLHKSSGLKKLGKTISLLLIIVLFFNISGHYIYFNVLQNNIRHEIKTRIRHGLHESELTIIEITAQNQTELTWIKPQKEFTYRGDMYDVVKVIEKNGTRYFHCINDTKENKLIREFAKRAESSQKARRLLSNISLTYIFQEEFYDNIIETSDHEYYTQPFNLTSKIKDTSDPPPKLFLPS
jgi:hypothetical protein